MTEVPVKHCKCCGETKPLDEFYSFKKRRDDFRWKNYSTLCKECHNKECVERVKRKKKDDPEYHAKALLTPIKKRCREAGLPCDLDVEWVAEKRRAGRCEVTGIPFDNDCGGGSINQRPWGFSLDRIDQSGGYTKDNVKAVVWAYNRAKGVGTHEDVMRLAEALCSKTR